MLQANKNLCCANFCVGNCEKEKKDVLLLLPGQMHMYVAEAHLLHEDNFFAFLMSKYCVGFLHVILVPVATLALRTDIRTGTRKVFGSTAFCRQEGGGGGGGGEEEEGEEAEVDAVNNEQVMSAEEHV